MTKAQTARLAKLLPDGKPRYIRCYDLPDTLDRYTVVLTGSYNNQKNGTPRRRYYYLGMSTDPFHGVGSFGEHSSIIDRPKSSHLGKRITFDELPPKCRKWVLQCYKETWNLPA